MTWLSTSAALLSGSLRNLTSRGCIPRPVPEATIPAGWPRVAYFFGCTDHRENTGHDTTRTISLMFAATVRGVAERRRRCGVCSTTPQAGPPSRMPGNCVNGSPSTHGVVSEWCRVGCPMVEGALRLHSHVPPPVQLRIARAYHAGPALHARIAKTKSTVRTTETAREPRQPRRLEKRKNIEIHVQDGRCSRGSVQITWRMTIVAGRHPHEGDLRRNVAFRALSDARNRPRKISASTGKSANQ